MTVPDHLRRPRRDATVPPPPADGTPEAPRVRTAHLAWLECEIARREAEGTLVPGHDGKEPTGIDGPAEDATIQNQEGLMRTMTPAQRAKKNARDRERRAEAKRGKAIFARVKALQKKMGGSDKVKKAQAPFAGGAAKVKPKGKLVSMSPSTWKKGGKIVGLKMFGRGSNEDAVGKRYPIKRKRGHGVGRGPDDAVQTCINIPRKLRNKIDAEAKKNAKRGAGADSRSALVLECLGKRWA